jgi:hypothetical protein
VRSETEPGATLFVEQSVGAVVGLELSDGRRVASGSRACHLTLVIAKRA